MKILRFVILAFIVWGLPSFLLVAFGETVGALSSHISNVLLLLYYLLSKKGKLIFPFIFLGILYFLISGAIDVPDSKSFINDFIKYVIFIVCGAEVARNTSLKDLIAFLLVGATSILAHAIFFTDNYGRYSGFYLDPNAAGFVSLIGYCLAYQLSNNSLKLILLFIFTFSGAITFSRYFFIMWLITSLIAIFSNVRNSQGILIGLGSLVVLISVASILQFNTARFSIVENLFERKIQTTAFTEHSRTEQWSAYLGDIFDNPIFGNGHQSFKGVTGVKQGVHNTYLMVIGESGIIPFLLIIGIYIYMVKRSLSSFKTNVYKIMIALTLLTFLMVIHNYFNNYLLLFISIWLLVKLNEVSIAENQNEIKEVITWKTT